MFKKLFLVFTFVFSFYPILFPQVYSRFYSYGSLPIIIKFVTNVDEKIFEEVYFIITNVIFSYSYEKGSYIYEITKACYRNYVSVDEDLHYMLGKLIYFNTISKNAISPTIGYIIDLWGFESKNFYIPTLSEISNALKISSTKNLLMSGKKIALRNKSTKFYLKPYAISMSLVKVKNFLNKVKINNAFVSVGNCSFALGLKDGEPWLVGIPDPLRMGEFYTTLSLGNKFAYTVDINENSFSDKFRTYHSVIDPRTGYPSDNGIVSVTVVGDDPLESTIFARMIFVLGKDAGLKIAEAHSVPALILYSVRNTIVEYKTKKWIKMFDKDTSRMIDQGNKTKTQK